jgi:hypothetical protein
MGDWLAVATSLSADIFVRAAARMVKRAGRPNLSLINGTLTISAETRSSHGSVARVGLPSWAEAGRAAKDNSKPEQQAVWLRRLLADPFIQPQRRTPNERSRK